jgi:cellulose biosynthesis protein BcsQ
LFKYQSLNKLFEQLCKWDDAFSLSDHPKADMSSGSAQITAVYSAKGGAGKTTVALYIAQAMLADRQRTLYMSLESLNAVTAILHSRKILESESRFSQLIYYLLTEPGKLQSRWDSYINVDRSTGLHFIAPEQSVREMEAMNGDTVKKLIDILAKSNRYDRIVLDLDSSLHARTVGALKRSDQIVWLVLADQASLYKTETARKQLPEHRNVHWVVNKHTGQWKPGHIDNGIDPQTYLPYIPEWKQVTETDNILAHRLFSDSIGQLIDRIYNPECLERLTAV